VQRFGLAIAFFLIGTLFCPAPASAQVEEVRIAVKGMSCELCAAGLERSLRRVDGVASVDVALAEEAAVVHLKSGTAFDPERFRVAVKNAGQEVRTFEVRVNGMVREENGRYSLQPGAGASLSVNSRSASKLKPFVGQSVRARARVLTLAQSRMELELTDVVAR
jgi:copper chaperone CopZ